MFLWLKSAKGLYKTSERLNLHCVTSKGYSWVIKLPWMEMDIEKNVYVYPKYTTYKHTFILRVHYEFPNNCLIDPNLEHSL